MRTALLLIDMQQHFLDSPGLQPCRGALIDAAAAVLSDFRAAGGAVLHIRTTLHSREEALPHWRTQLVLPCLAGSLGHGGPPELQPAPGEIVIHKRGFNAFEGGEIDSHLQRLEVQRVVLAGVHLRTCIRIAASEAHQRGFRVLLVSGAVGDDDPLHAEVTRRWLEQRGIPCLHRQAVASMMRAERPDPPAANGSEACSPIVHASPLDSGTPLWQVEPSPLGQIHQQVRLAEAAAGPWSAWAGQQRCAVLARFRDCLQEHSGAMAEQITRDTGKPIQAAHSEIHFALQLIDDAIGRLSPHEVSEHGEGWKCRRRPHGVLAAITPWNNPVAIPVGKLVPALLHGNTVVWKPAMAGTGLARSCLQLLEHSGLPPGCVGLIEGGGEQAIQLMEQPGVAAITITGSAEAGMAAQVVAARRRLPLQAELGGNNAAVVWECSDLAAAAAKITTGAFGCAGQRCTANRRVIVADEHVDTFRQHLLAAMETLPWGDPWDDSTVVGPVISLEAAERLEALVARARRGGCRIHQRSDPKGLGQRTRCYVPPTLIEANDPGAEWVQEESFGPILVLQAAATWQQALELCNGVRQGLVAALFSDSAQHQAEFLNQARAGMLKINASTAGVHPSAPFGGWGESGIGSPEHGRSDVDFYTRNQTIYPDAGFGRDDVQSRS